MELINNLFDTIHILVLILYKVEKNIFKAVNKKIHIILFFVSSFFLALT
jgi:hypothetical protein